MKLTLRIQKNETKEVRELSREFPDDFPTDYFFGDGNGGCDCQRADWFESAGGSEDPNIPCSEDQYSLDVVDANGQPLYSEITP